eukprot:TRINITY_DN13894_c0_g1_i2.p1 TRINITY_DN13894_c0_g1~~TRINITY_DN13894_c0_g1_i2.p1  ORF type:complete len:251 (+),score=56.39 TRINITY_DN13894_c0_g1_i2:143-895(+)
MGICDSSDQAPQHLQSSSEEAREVRMRQNSIQDRARIDSSPPITLNIRIVDSFVYTPAGGEPTLKEELKEEIKEEVRSLSRVRELKRQIASRWSLGVSSESAVYLRFQLLAPETNAPVATLENDWEWSGKECAQIGLVDGSTIEVDGAREIEDAEAKPESARHKEKCKNADCGHHEILTVEEKRTLFNHHDVNGDGSITIAELAGVLRNVYSEHAGTTDADVADYVKDIDEDGDGQLQFEEFCKALDGFE